MDDGFAAMCSPCETIGKVSACSADIAGRIVEGIDIPLVFKAQSTKTVRSEPLHGLDSGIIKQTVEKCTAIGLHGRMPEKLDIQADCARLHRGETNAHGR